MSDDLIRRSDAIKSLDNAWINGTGLLDANEAIKQLNDLPSADRPKGKWIDTEPDIPDASVRKGNKPYVCSVCGHSAGKYKYKTYKFCPWCGAKMEEGHE